MFKNKALVNESGDLKFYYLSNINISNWNFKSTNKLNKWYVCTLCAFASSPKIDAVHRRTIALTGFSLSSIITF